MKYCTNCGKEIKEGADFCTSCGKSIKKEVKTNKVINEEEPVKYNQMATAGFVLAMVSLLLNFFGIVGLLATIFSGIGLSKISQTQEKGKGLAIAGLIVGIFSLIYGIVATINIFIS